MTGVAVGNRVIATAIAHIDNTPYEVAITVGRHAVLADEPKSLGGKDAGPSPFGLLLAALGACTSATLKMYAERKGWSLKSLDVSLRLIRSHPDDAPRIERILTPVGLDAEQSARLAEIAERTPVTLAIKAGVSINTSLSEGQG